MHTRYVITAIKKDGTRQLAFDNNHLNTYLKKEDAEKRMYDTLNNNSPETVKELVGKNLRVQPVECYDSGDSSKTFFK